MGAHPNSNLWDVKVSIFSLLCSRIIDIAYLVARINWTSLFECDIQDRICIQFKENYLQEMSLFFRECESSQSLNSSKVCLRWEIIHNDFFIWTSLSKRDMLRA